jgi:uncharacterized small protein (DUF1192 family)
MNQRVFNADDHPAPRIQATSIADEQLQHELPLFPINPHDRDTLDSVLYKSDASKLSFSDEAEKIRRITEYRENRKKMRAQLQKVPTTPSTPVFNLSHPPSNLPVIRPATDFYHQEEPRDYKKNKKKFELENESLQNSINQLNKRIAALEEIIEIQSNEIDNAAMNDGTQIVDSEAELQINMLKK